MLLLATVFARVRQTIPHLSPVSLLLFPTPPKTNLKNQTYDYAISILCRRPHLPNELCSQYLAFPVAGAHSVYCSVYYAFRWKLPPNLSFLDLLHFFLTGVIHSSTFNAFIPNNQGNRRLEGLSRFTVVCCVHMAAYEAHTRGDERH